MFSDIDTMYSDHLYITRHPCYNKRVPVIQILIPCILITCTLRAVHVITRVPIFSDIDTMYSDHLYIRSCPCYNKSANVFGYWYRVFLDHLYITSCPCYNKSTVNPLYNVGVGPQWFMTLKWICRCNDFLLFRPQDEKTQKKCSAISTWFAVSESLTSNLDKSAETRCRTIFPNQVFR